MIKSDLHLHTMFSFDSETDPQKMIESAIEKGLKTICITDHHDLDFAEASWEVDFERYFPYFEEMQKKYKQKIEILIGVEMGLQPHLKEKNEDITKKYPFDFVIGSVHLFDGCDPYYPEYFADKTDEDGYRRAFEITLDNLKVAEYYDSLGHLDYIVRCGKKREEEYQISKYTDYIDEILKIIISKGKGLEINSGGIKKGLSFAHPHPEILKRYKELGGEIITIGSDAHEPKDIASHHSFVKDRLESCGFKYYAEFRKRKAEFYNI